MKRLLKDKVRTTTGEEKEINQSISIKAASEMVCHSERAVREQRGRPLLTGNRASHLTPKML